MITLRMTRSTYDRMLAILDRAGSDSADLSRIGGTDYFERQARCHHQQEEIASFLEFYGDTPQIGIGLPEKSPSNEGVLGL